MNRPVSAMSLPQGVAEHLKSLIHRGELGPGDRLPPERDLADRLGVARVSLREAIKLLHDGGYVDVRRGAKGGTFVTELRRPFEDWRKRMREQSGEIDDIIDFRIGLEAQSAFLAAHRRSKADLTALRAAMKAMGRSESTASFRLADSRFHGGVAQCGRNARLENAIHTARGELFSPYDILDYVAPVAESQHDHREIYQAIRDRDPQAASTLMREHIDRTRGQLRVIVFGSASWPGS